MNPLFYKFGSLAILLESTGAWLLASDDSLHLLMFWVVHGAASVLTGLLAWTLLPVPLRQPKRLALSLFVLLALVFPLVGVLGLLVTARLAQWMPLTRPDTDLLRTTPQLEVFAVSHIDDDVRRDLPAGRVAQIARDQSQPQATRIRAVLALREMTPRMALPVLRRLLTDPDEEIRLLAYGISNTWEQKLTDSLQAAQREFEAARHDANPQSEPLARTAQRVAELQMEFIYQGLAQGDLGDFALDQALTHCRIARDALPHDTGLQMMLLRLALARGDVDTARDVLDQLAADGASPTLWRPYAAELQWVQRKYGQISPVLQPLNARQLAPRLRPIARVWQTATAAAPDLGDPRFR